MSLSGQRGQRWLQWRNMDVSTTPICPAYGCVEIVGYETVGAKIILQGRSAVLFDDDFSGNTIAFSGITPVSITFPSYNTQGAKWRHAFNGEVSVNPGEIGHVTFDLPTWGATTDHANDGFGGLPFAGLHVPLFMGSFYDTAKLRIVSTNPTIYTLGIAVFGERWRIGSTLSAGYPSNMNPGSLDPGSIGSSILYRGGEAGWNCLHYDATAGTGNHKAWVGGARTFLQHPNRRAD